MKKVKAQNKKHSTRDANFAILFNFSRQNFHFSLYLSYILALCLSLSLALSFSLLPSFSLFGSCPFSHQNNVFPPKSQNFILISRLVITLISISSWIKSLELQVTFTLINCINRQYNKLRLHALKRRSQKVQYQFHLQ